MIVNAKYFKDCNVFGIIYSNKIYRLAYIINDKLNIKFEKIETKTSFPIFKTKKNHNTNEILLLTNKASIKEEVSYANAFSKKQTDFFEKESFSKKIYFSKTLKIYDYFLIYPNELSLEQKQDILDKLTNYYSIFIQLINPNKITTLKNQLITNYV